MSEIIPKVVFSCLRSTERLCRTVCALHPKSVKEAKFKMNYRQAEQNYAFGTELDFVHV